MTRVSVLLLVPVVSLIACHPDKPAESATTTTVSQTTTTTSMTTTGIYLETAVATACNVPQPKVFFKYDSAHVENTDASSVDQLVQCLTTGALKGKAIDIVGRTDPRGSDEYNKQLGKSRAEAVASLLIERGIDSNMVHTRSSGEERAKGNDENGWAYDRRVDVRLTGATAATTTTTVPVTTTAPSTTPAATTSTTTSTSVTTKPAGAK